MSLRSAQPGGGLACEPGAPRHRRGIPCKPQSWAQRRRGDSVGTISRRDGLDARHGDGGAPLSETAPLCEATRRSLRGAAVCLLERARYESERETARHDIDRLRTFGE